MSMDKVFKSDEKQFISPPISLSAFLQSALAMTEKFGNLFAGQDEHRRENVMDFGVNSDNDDGTADSARKKFLDFMVGRGYDEDTASNSMANVDDNFKKLIDSNPMPHFEITFPPKNSALKTHKILHQIREDFPTTANKNQLVLRGKYFKYRDQELKREFTPYGKTSAKDIVMTVHLLAPMNRPPETFESSSLKNRCEVKLLVRGNTPLVKLRNKIFCASDFWCNLKDDEEMVDKNAFFSKLFPSNFVFVHDTFYVDNSEGTIDISEPIRQFMDRKTQEFGPYHVKDIAETNVIDLNLRLGQPYVYQHQGRCEHLLIFSDLRLLNASDEQNDEEYPIRVYDIVHQILCCTCKDTQAVFVITESDRMPICPAYMCEKCFRDFHYDGETRIGEFTAYHYNDRAGTE